MIIAVSGLWRCGSSLMMQILKEAGYSPIMDQFFRFDEYNQNGYYEIDEENAETIYNKILMKKYGEDCCIKILQPVLEVNKIINLVDVVIWMERDIDEIILSTENVFNASPYPRKLRIIERDGKLFLKKKQLDPYVINYNQIIKNQRKELSKIEHLLFDFEKSMEAIDTTLYKCRIKKDENKNLVF